MKYLTKKGFTLIELLAVIVILAVIALIAVPIIMGVINDAKKGAAKDSTYSYVKAVELAATKGLKPDSDLLSGTYTVKDGNLYIGSTKILSVDLKGTKPANDGSVKLEKGQVKSADLTFDEYCIGYDGNKAVNKDNCEVAPPTANPSVAYTEGDIVYYNPETNKKCTAGEVNTAVNAKTGCMSWNVITVGDTSSKTTVDIMLGHNTTSTVAWNSTGTNAEMKEVVISLQTDVTSWNSSVKSTARLITGQEVANIVKNTSWTAGGSYIMLPTQPWLYQNTDGHGDNTNSGYWTATAYWSTTGNSTAWRVYSGGYLIDSGVSSATFYGVRPVITISKSAIA